MPVKAKPLRGALRAACDRRSALAQCAAIAERGKPVRRFARTIFKLIFLLGESFMSKQVRRIGISIIVSIIMFGISALITRGVTGTYNFSPPFIITAITLCITQMINVYNRLDDHEEKLTNELRSFNVISKVGTAEDGISYIKRKIREAESVDNTYIRFKDYSVFDDNAYPKDWHDEIYGIVEQFCMSGKKWRDVVSKSKNRNKTISKIKSNQKIKSYFVKYIDESPTMNYIIFHYENEKEVLFGWATIKDYPGHILVWSTKQPQLTEYFAHHFNMLFNSGSEGEEA